MAPYSSRHSVPLGGNRHALGGAGLNLDVSALGGETDMATAFEDFNQNVALAGAGANTPLPGWTATDITGVAGQVGINPQVSLQHFASSLTITCGATANGGLNLQPIGDSRSPYIWISDDVTPTSQDQTIFTFACRVGLGNAIGVGPWEGKAFVGFAGNPDAGVMTAVGGALAVPSFNGLVGFHVAEDGHVDFVSQRLAATALVAGTNFTPVFPAGTIDFTFAEQIVWLDLAFVLTFVDGSDATNNGSAEAFVRRVPLPGGPVDTANTQVVGRESRYTSGNDVATDAPWSPAGAVLLNQNPRPSSANGELIPTIELLNGPTGAAQQSTLLLDWWSMGHSRLSRRQRDIP